MPECEICSKLRDVETSFSKWGWPEMDRPFPAEVGRLVAAEDASGEKENHHVKRCPICGTCYSYDFSYEYLVNGSEDEALLTRLTPEEAAARLGTNP